jgi:hypothetical protein
MKAFSLGGFEGDAWKMPPTDETFDAEKCEPRASMPWSVRFLAACRSPNKA